MDSNSLSLRQKQHYESIHSAYEEHYFDACSMRYRERFMLGPLLEGLQLNGTKVADFACGSGYNSVAILNRFPKATAEGFDISAHACEAYRRIVQAPAHDVDLTSGIAGDSNFDAAIIVGGLHHCISNLEGTIRSISSFLKPGGTLLIFEPSKDFFLQGLRTLWYRTDNYFDAQTEEALSHDELARLASPYFDVEDVRYMGGPGYFLILNSLILRIPLGLKRLISAPLMQLDSAYNRMPWRAAFPYFLARWKRKD